MYVVRKGDSLWKIAQMQLGDATRWPDIAKLNNLKPPYRLMVGQPLKLPLSTRMATPLVVPTRPPTSTPPRTSVAAPSPSQGPPSSSNEAQTPAGLLLGRAYLFVVIQEVSPSAKLVRKVMLLPETDVNSLVVNRPDLFGFHPRDPKATTTLGEHALGNTMSKYISASDKPGGAPNFKGVPWYIDVAKAKQAGATIHEAAEIIADLDRLASQYAHLKPRIDKLKSVISTVEGEVLIEGRVPRSAVQSAEQAAREVTLLRGMSKGAKALGVVGVVFTVYDMGSATVQSVQQGSAKPVVAETIRQVGGWAGAWAGMKLGFMGGAAVGIETGPGALLTGLAGGVIFGAVGYFGADWLADEISPN